MAATDIESLLWREGILLAVNDNEAVTLTAVYDAELTVVEEVLLLDVLVNVKTELPEVLQLQGLVYWHSTTEDEAVIM